MSEAEQHSQRVAAISARVSDFYSRHESFRMYHGYTLSGRTPKISARNVIDTSGLNHIIGIIAHPQGTSTALVEPNVTIGHLAKETMKIGLLPEVVMEFPDLTIGGTFSGTGGESSSFKYGSFELTMKSIEVVLGNGDVVKASAENNPDLFFGAAGACGTLGVITLLEVKLIKAKSYVELTYYPVAGPLAVEEMAKCLQEECRKPSHDYLDAILFSKDAGVVMAGQFVDSPSAGSNVQCFSRPCDPWFYLHARDNLRRRLQQAKTDTRQQQCSPWKVTIPTLDYLFRFDRGTFWNGGHEINAVLRFVLDKQLRSKHVFRMLSRSGMMSQAIEQELSIPFHRLSEMVEFETDTVGTWPLYISATAVTRDVLDHCEEGKAFVFPRGCWAHGEMLAVLAIFGAAPPEPDMFEKVNKDLEEMARALGGTASLSGYFFSGKEMFWEMYDEDWYMELRRKYHAETLPSIMDKLGYRRQPVADGWTRLKQGLLALFWFFWPL